MTWEPQFYAGLDVDTKSIGFIVFDSISPPSEQFRYTRVLTGPQRKVSLEERAVILNDGLRDAIRGAPYIMGSARRLLIGIEKTVIHGRSVADVSLATGIATGLLYLWGGGRWRFKFFHPQTGKTAITGMGRPKKEVVVAMAREWLGDQEANEHVCHAAGMALAAYRWWEKE